MNWMQRFEENEEWNWIIVIIHARQQIKCICSIWAKMKEYFGFSVEFSISKRWMLRMPTSARTLYVELKECSIH